MLGRSLLLGGGAIPATPNLPAAAVLLCRNNTAGSGTFQLAFNATAKTATFSSSSSLGTPQNFTVTYFAAGDTVSPNDYEIMASVSSGPTTGANIALSTGSALNTWHVLGASPAFNFSCSGRRSGFLNISITIRHRVQTAYSSTRIYALEQQSDAVAPTFSGTTVLSLSMLASEAGVMGVYFDAGSGANQFQCRAYRQGSYIIGNTLSFNTGGISESEYEIYNIEYSHSAAMAFNLGLGTGNIGSKRSNSANQASGSYFSADGAAGSGAGYMRVHIRHVTDLTKANSVTLDFYKTVS